MGVHVCCLSYFALLSKFLGCKYCCPDFFPSMGSPFPLPPETITFCEYFVPDVIVLSTRLILYLVLKCSSYLHVCMCLSVRVCINMITHAKQDVCKYASQLQYAIYSPPFFLCSTLYLIFEPSH